jgi:hypothetical protein
MTESKYAPSTWGKELFIDLTTPSGQLCQVRVPGVQALIAAGVLESADTLTSLVDSKHIKRVQGKATPSKNAVNLGKDGGVGELDTESLMKDPAALQKVFNLVDKVSEYMVVQPTVRRPIRKLMERGKEIELPLAPDDREEGIVYTDTIDVTDRMFILNYAIGGSTDVEAFREQLPEGMGSVAAE